MESAYGKDLARTLHYFQPSASRRTFSIHGAHTYYDISPEALTGGDVTGVKSRDHPPDMRTRRGGGGDICRVAFNDVRLIAASREKLRCTQALRRHSTDRRTSERPQPTRLAPPPHATYHSLPIRLFLTAMRSVGERRNSMLQLM